MVAESQTAAASQMAVASHPAGHGRGGHSRAGAVDSQVHQAEEARSQVVAVHHSQVGAVARQAVA